MIICAQHIIHSGRQQSAHSSMNMPKPRVRLREPIAPDPTRTLPAHLSIDSGPRQNPKTTGSGRRSICKETDSYPPKPTPCIGAVTLVSYDDRATDAAHLPAQALFALFIGAE